MTLSDLGWNEAFETEFAPYYAKGWKPARLIRDNRITYGALLGDGTELEVVMSGKVYHDAATDAELPAVGDWVALEIAGDEVVIQARLTRQSCFSRRAPGEGAEEQVLAANIDAVVVVTDAGTDLNLRRLERFFALIARSRARAVVLLNKSDLFSEEQNQSAAASIRALYAEADVHITSARRRRGLQALKQYLKPGATVAFVGCSGVGKSAIFNRMLGDDLQCTGMVNETTGKGRHTTSARELILLPSGGMVMDNPGIREVQMWTDEHTLRESFSDLSNLATTCRFHDCKHGSDAGCAIRNAVRDGLFAVERLEAFLKLDEEIEKLRKRRKKRQFIDNRLAKRKDKSRPRNREDQLEEDGVY